MSHAASLPERGAGTNQAVVSAESLRSSEFWVLSSELAGNAERGVLSAESLESSEL